MKADDVFVSNSTLISQLAPKLVIVVRDSEVKLMHEDLEITSKQFLESQL
jgi:hypothetical protein